jgi:hypothetical protein
MQVIEVGLEKYYVKRRLVHGGSVYEIHGP